MAVRSGKVRGSVMMYYCQTNVRKVVHTAYEEERSMQSHIHTRQSKVVQTEICIRGK